MSRTTVNIDAPILRDLKRLQKEQRKSLGQIISELIAQALNMRKAQKTSPAVFSWKSQPMKSLVNLEDKEAVRRLTEKYKS